MCRTMAPLVVVYQPVDKMQAGLIFCRKNVNLKCVPTGALRKNQERFFFPLKFSALKNFSAPTFGIHKSDQFFLEDQVQEMSELRPTFNNSIESNFIYFYISMSFYFFLFSFYFFLFLFFFQKTHFFSLEALCVLLLDSELVALLVYCNTVIWRQ